MTKRWLRAGLVVVLLLAANVPAQGADIGAGCGSTSGGYSRTAHCRLVFRGFPVTIFADAKASGTATVRAWITIDDLDEAGAPDLPILSCQSSGSGYASCDAGLPDQTTEIDHYALEQFHLHCHVESNGTGAYRCVSASGR